MSALLGLLEICCTHRVSGSTERHRILADGGVRGGEGWVHGYNYHLVA